jgi:glycosyltransferase involved in cell wall biosynthesis
VEHPTVLHLIGSLDGGGTEHQLVEFIRRSSSPGDHAVAVFSRPGDLASSLPRPPIVLASVDRSNAVRSGLRAVSSLRQLVRTMRPRLVHAHLAHAEVLAAIAVPRDTPIVASRRGRTPLFETPVIGPLALGVAQRRERLIICNTVDLASHVRRRHAPTTVVIPNGVDGNRFTPSPLPGGRPTVVVVARLRRQKAHDRFIRAFRMVQHRLPDARAVLVGDGPLRSELEHLVADLGLAGSVKFTGAVSDTRPHLAAATVVALTSPYEGFPNALLEAMACGRPVVATSVGGVPEMVEHGREGLLVGQSDAQIADALLELLNDPERAARMGEAARCRAETFDWSLTVSRTEAVYRSALEANASGVVRVGVS